MGSWLVQTARRRHPRGCSSIRHSSAVRYCLSIHPTYPTRGLGTLARGVRQRTGGDGSSVLRQGSSSFGDRCQSPPAPFRSPRQFSTRTGDHYDAPQYTDGWTISSSHRGHLIFGANTDVGKTVVTAGLVRAALARGRAVQYLKPLQTGGPALDQTFVQRYTSEDHGFAARIGLRDCRRDDDHIQGPSLTTRTLFSWDMPTSPHLASRHHQRPVDDTQVLQAVRDALAHHPADPTSTTTWVETAGGVLSPAAASPRNQQHRHALSPRSQPTKGAAFGEEEANTNSWGWSTQADLYQPLLGQLPVILVGDGRLGGISATLSSLESLLVRGYDVASVVFVSPASTYSSSRVWLDNAEALREYVSRPAFPLRAGSGEALLTRPDQAIVSLPPLPTDPNQPLYEWYESAEVSDTLAQLEDFLQQQWQGQVDDWRTMPSAGRNVLWWPFTQHGHVQNDHQITVLDSAAGDYYHVIEEERSAAAPSSGAGEPSSTPNLSPPRMRGRPLFDACASWWTQGLGHGNSSLALAGAAAAGRYGHVLFPQTVHAPALSLAHKLVGPMGPGHGWADRVFYTDNGSTAMEVAIKMGIKTYQKRVRVTDRDRESLEWVVCAQAGCYHGDTLGAMDVAEPSVFNQGQHPWYEPKGLFLETPVLGFRDGVLNIEFPEGWEPPTGSSYTFESIQQAMDVDARLLTRLMPHYKEMIDLQWVVYEHSGVNRKIASVVLEPILMGAGGMKFVDPLWQRALISVAETRNVPVIYDEVAAGLYRLGVKSCREILKYDPDIAAYAKLLTGGVVPLSVTLASEEVFETFLGDEKGSALLHGHSYTAHPVGCVSAIHSLEAYEAAFKANSDRKGLELLFDEKQTAALSQIPMVESSFALGSVLAVALRTEEGGGGYAAVSKAVPIVERLREKGVFARPLGNVVYIMASPLTGKNECARLMEVLHATIASVHNGQTDSASPDRGYRDSIVV